MYIFTCTYIMYIYIYTLVASLGWVGARRLSTLELLNSLMYTQYGSIFLLMRFCDIWACVT